MALELFLLDCEGHPEQLAQMCIWVAQVNHTIGVYRLQGRKKNNKPNQQPQTKN